MLALDVGNLSINADDRPLLVDASFSVETGEVVAFVGPSGCGKTTLLRAIAGLHTLIGGRIIVNGADVTKRTPHERGISMLFQDPALFPEKSVEENALAATLARRVHPQQLAEKRAEMGDLLDAFGMGELRNTATKYLSGGERQRAAIVRCLLNTQASDLLILDEPFKSALNHEVKWDLMVRLKGMHKDDKRRTTLFVTHDFTEAAFMAHRIAVLDSRKVLTGTPGEFWGRPPTLAVAMLLDSANRVVLNDFARALIAQIVGKDPPREATDWFCRPCALRRDGRGPAFKIVETFSLGGQQRVLARSESTPSVLLKVDLVEQVTGREGETITLCAGHSGSAFFKQGGMLI